MASESPPLSGEVSITGIGARPELNDQRARVLRFDASSQRYVVLLNDGTKVKLKAAHYATTTETDSDVTPRFLGLRDFFAENEDKSGAKLFVTVAKMFGVIKHFLHFGNGCEIPLM